MAHQGSSHAGAWGRHGIRWRVGVLVGFGGLIPMAVAAWAGWSGMNAAGAQLVAERGRLAASLAARLDQQLEEDLGSLAATALGWSFGSETELARDREALHLARLRSRRIETVFVTRPDGTVASAEPSAPGALPLSVEGVAIARALQTGRPAVRHLVGAGGQSVVLLLVPVLDSERRTLGLVGGVVGRPEVSYAPLLAPGSSGAAGAVALVDEDGTVVVEAPAGGPDETPREKTEVVASAPLTVAPWQVVVRQPEALTASAIFTRRLLVLGPTVLGLALLFAWGAARSLTRPLSALVDAAGRIAGGDIDRPTPELGDDEVGRLARSFEAMRTALARSIDALHSDRADLERRVAERTQELAGLYDELRRHDERRGQLIRKTISAQEDERMRIARELHDETCQSLAALLMRFDAALAVRDPEGLRARISEARSLVDRALGEVHRMIFDLRPSVLDDLGLVPAIQWFAARHLEPHGIAVRCEAEGMASRLPPETETALFRAVQEALTNVARHAGAEAVLIQIARRGDVVELEIEDDGNGFDPALVAGPAPSGRGLGLMGMRERIELLGGSAQIESSPGHGTRVAFRVPVPEAVLSNGGGVG